MVKSKVLQLLKTLTPQEFKKYGLFIGSPYFNKENVQIKIYELLKKHYPAFDSPVLAKAIRDSSESVEPSLGKRVLGITPPLRQAGNENSIFIIMLSSTAGQETSWRASFIHHWGRTDIGARYRNVLQERRST